MDNENSTGKGCRTRNWTFILYDDSAPDNWRDLLDEQHVEWVESPYHEFDVNPTGELKKPHRHIVVLFSGVKSYDQVIEFLQPFNCPRPERVHNIKSMVRYLVHMDNPEKHQYDIKDIKTHGGVDLDDLLKPSNSERYALYQEMLEYVDSHGITEYQDLVDYARCERFSDWFPVVVDGGTYFLTSYIKSKRDRRRFDSSEVQ